ncbi:hypothetical protein Q763_09530 [Flavobacterium beibuense F44-8]|uniref:Histidine kinase/HSP90-like ATPase domain-containing protein n=1 Tax=Flavobacterium beibuense F44-8 TaxID=1406840 RepID=A0A0A2LNK5_9FLAO|nr:sensor histidine kinase [Flavobacterium beibuense]KGO80768.1 hypothetical protein Q763_09530 [Flavobacterium beibuense F44-8]
MTNTTITYKQKFEESEHKAHYQNIATKILRDMNDLRSKAQDSVTAPRRWIWELIQNAKDVHYDNGVNIRIDFEDDDLLSKVIFRHNGKPFTADNIRFLIEQISTKDRAKDTDGKRKNTGRFGTGFLTTHLLSEVVTVNGVAKEPELPYRKFTLTLDRSGYELEEITTAVQKAKDSVANLDEIEPYKSYNKDNLNTSFSYSLPDKLSIQIANAGFEDLQKCLPFALLFVNEIEAVEVFHLNHLYYTNKNKAEETSLEYRSVFIQKGDKDTTEELTYVKLTKGFTNIVVPINTNGGEIEILPINKDTPKLFCDFPLIGTEIFPFPVIVNNPNFNPTDPRDGVFLNSTEQRSNPLVQENKKIVDEAIELYFILLDFAIENKWKNLHLLAEITPLKQSPYWINESWFNDSVLKPLRSKILRSKIVNTADGNLTAILGDDDKAYIWFPYSNRKEIREKMWGLAKEWFPHQLPAKDQVELWYRLAWNECAKLTLDQFSAFVEYKKKVSDLEKVLANRSGIEWLNDFYLLLKLDEKEFHSIMENRVLIPDQNGDFWKKAQLSLDKGDIEETFKDILKEFGNDIRAKLADNQIGVDFGDKIIDQSYVIKEITSEVNSKTIDREVAQEFRNALNQLLLYFRKYPEKAKQLFPTIYRSKHLLYDDEEILENIDKAEQLDDLLKEFNVNSTEDLRALLGENTNDENNLLPITQELLVSMGISNIEDWKKALEDKDLKSLFAHDSIPTTDMFVLAQSFIAQAKQRVIDHLETLDEYDLSLMDDQTATTILAGIYKNNQPISIVFRPAYSGEVIIYYGSERDTLDYESSELWVDDGTDVKQITLGHILKSAQIRKFPI